MNARERRVRVSEYAASPHHRQHFPICDSRESLRGLRRGPIAGTKAISAAAAARAARARESTMTLSASLTTPIRVAALAGALALVAGAAAAGPSLVVDVDSGQTLSENNATEPWYPASLTKLMTTYVALQAVRDGRLTLDTPLTMSARAASMPASKMGFAPGVEVTLDNALKMLMVKSPNDVAVMIAESIDGSVEAFAAEMNATALKLGMREFAFRQSQRPARSRPCLFRARHGDRRPRAVARFSRAARPLWHRRAAARRRDHRQSQRPARTLSRRRRDEDRLHLSGRLQRRRDRDPRRAPADRRRARRAFAARAHDGGGAPV